MNKFCLILALLPAGVAAEPYVMLGVEGVFGRRDTAADNSALVTTGLGVATSSGWYVETTAGLNVEELLFDNRSYRDSEHVGYFLPMAGYNLRGNSSHWFKVGLGYQAAFFKTDCRRAYLGADQKCERSTDYGPAYGVGYHYSSDGSGGIGLEYRRYDLSETRRYGSLSITVKAFFP
jgi:hypothetical protein